MSIILNPPKSVGPNSIPIKLLKIIRHSVSPLLALRVNKSFQSGIFPDKLKIVKVISSKKEILSLHQTIGHFLFDPFSVKYLRS